MDESYRTIANYVIDAVIPPARGMGIKITELSQGHAVAVAPLEDNSNHLGTMYAGTLFGVAEILGGVICLPSFDMGQYRPTVKSFRIRFHRPATTAVQARTELPQEMLDRVRAQAEATGKAEFVLTAEITDANGQVVATTEGTYQIRRNPA